MAGMTLGRLRWCRAERRAGRAIQRTGDRGKRWWRRDDLYDRPVGRWR
jgi:hypothetical protein